MKCSLCHSEAVSPYILAGKPLCGTCFALIAKHVEPKTPSMPKALRTSIDTRYYWHVQSGDFTCIIDWRDAQDEASALKEAANPLTRWYFVGSSLPDAMAGYTTARKINHNKFCDWLREGRRSFGMKEAQQDV